jgi:hypothetical protein
MKMLKAISLAMMFVLTPAVLQAENEPVPVGDVKHLLKNADEFADKRITVAGEVEEFLDPRSFVLESGGFLMDEITVIMPEGAKGVDPALLREDSEVRVIGTVRTFSAVDIEREFDWDFAPAITVDLEKTNTYLVAEKIEAR